MPAKVCIKCGRDCTDLPRRKNPRGQYMCQECLEGVAPPGAPPPPGPSARAAGEAPLADDATIAVDAEDPALVRGQAFAPPKMCAGCGTVMRSGAVICSSCGLSSATGTYIGTGKTPGASGTCAKCGYSMAGLKSPVCPECGTVNPAARRGSGAGKASFFRDELLEPIIYLGAALVIGGLSLLGDTGRGQTTLLLTAVIMLPVAALQYFLCGMIWVGFERPMRFVALRLLASLALSIAVGLLAGQFGVFALLRYGPMLLALGFSLYNLMDIDIGDSMAVSTIIMMTTIAIHMTLLFRA